MPPTKKDLATLIGAYADAKASKNPVLINMMAGHVERVLNELFPEDEKEDVGF
jgi:hypothetical protein